MTVTFELLRAKLAHWGTFTFYTSYGFSVSLGDHMTDADRQTES